MNVMTTFTEIGAHAICFYRHTHVDIFTNNPNVSLGIMDFLQNILSKVSFSRIVFPSSKKSAFAKIFTENHYDISSSI